MRLHAYDAVVGLQVNSRLFEALDQLLNLPYFDILLGLVRLWLGAHVCGYVVRTSLSVRVREMWGVEKVWCRAKRLTRRVEIACADVCYPRTK